jgi:hypothetical protein
LPRAPHFDQLGALPGSGSWVIDQEQNPVVHDASAGDAPALAHECGTRSLVCVASNHLVHRIGVVLSTRKQANHHVLRQSLEPQPLKCSRARRVHARRPLVDHGGCLVPHSFGEASIQELRAKQRDVTG